MTEPTTDWDEETLVNRFDLYGALYVLCSLYHSGQSSRGYRILSRLDRGGYRPSPFLSEDHFESVEQERIYRELVATYHDKL